MTLSLESFSWQFEIHFFEQFGAQTLGFADHAQARLSASTQWGDNIHGTQIVDLVEDLAGAVAQALGLEPALQGAPHHQGDEADQDVGLHAVFFVMKEWPQAQIAFAAPKGIFGLGQLDVALPQLAGILADL